MSDTDFSNELNNAKKQIEKAKELASQHLGIKAKHAKHTTNQGCFSKTIEVILENSTAVIIQFRIKALGTEPFNRARALLGDKVPIIEAIDDRNLANAGMLAFYMSRIPGKPWGEYKNLWNDKQRIKAAKSLGKLFACCFTVEDASDTVYTAIIPNLCKIRALQRDDLKEFFPYIEKLIADATALKKLPSFLGHFDLNEFNLMVGEDSEVTGVVDWELSPGPRPFGIACYCIQFLAGEIVDKYFRERAAFEAMDRAFWEGLLENTPEKIQAVLDSNMEAVQTGVLIGMLFRVMAIEGDNVVVNERFLKSLHKLMSYRIPPIRGLINKAYAV